MSVSQISKTWRSCSPYLTLAKLGFFVLMVDAYHEFAWPWEVMTAVYDSLAPGGKIVLIEYRAEDPDVPILRLHKMTAEQARLEMEAINASAKSGTGVNERRIGLGS